MDKEGRGEASVGNHWPVVNSAADCRAWLQPNRLNCSETKQSAEPVLSDGKIMRGDSPPTFFRKALV